MARLRMEWNMVNGYPIIVYMRFIDHGVWDVKLVKGAKGNPNDSSVDTSPTAPAWKTYRTKGPISRAQVCTEACRRARKWLKGEGVT